MPRTARSRGRSSAEGERSVSWRLAPEPRRRSLRHLRTEDARTSGSEGPLPCLQHLPSSSPTSFRRPTSLTERAANVSSASGVRSLGATSLSLEILLDVSGQLRPGSVGHRSPLSVGIARISRPGLAVVKVWACPARDVHGQSMASDGTRCGDTGLFHVRRRERGRIAFLRIVRIAADRSGWRCRGDAEGRDRPLLRPCGLDRVGRAGSTRNRFASS